MKNLELAIGFESIKNHLNEFEKQFSSIYLRSEKIYKNAGFKGRVLLYSCASSELDREDYLYLTIDYIARVCWAFHSQNQIEFLKMYKETFFDCKISNTTVNAATSKLIDFERAHMFKSHGLVDLFSYNSVQFEKSDSDLENWCDGLKIIRVETLKKVIRIIYSIDNDRMNRILLNPIKNGILSRLQYIEHIESLNLVIHLTLKEFQEDSERTKMVLKIISNSWEYFINNPQALITPQQSNQEVYNIINKTSVA